MPAPTLQVSAGQVRPALTLVGFEEELRPAMAYVFGSTFVCDTLETAKKVTFDKQVMTRSVALAGDVFDPSGTLTGGQYLRYSCSLVPSKKKSHFFYFIQKKLGVETGNEASTVELQRGSQLVPSIHVLLVLFLPTTNWLANISSNVYLITKGI